MDQNVNILMLIVIVCIATFWGCAQQRPVLYPNEHLKQVGSETSQADVDACMRLATEHGAKEDVGGRIAKDTASSAAVGAAAGAAIAAVFGNDIGRAAGAGAAGAGAATATRGMIDSGEPDPIFRSFVEKCLREKGYETVGWR
jgi:hypothetical protein